MPEIDGLFDTSVLVDLWRRNPVAVAWLAGLPLQSVIAIPVLVAMELVDGARDSLERHRAHQLIDPYPVIHITLQDSIWAQQQHAEFKLSHSVGIIDALIASPAARLAVPIYTLNIKHFAPLPGVTTFKPY